MKRTDKKARQEYRISEENILEVKDLRVNIKVDDYVLNAVRGVSFTMKKGETLGLVGESGCGKSVTSKEIMGINPNNCSSTGEVLFRTKSGKVLNLLTLDKDGEVYRGIRGTEMAMIFQEPMTAFSPSSVYHRQPAGGDHPDSRAKDHQGPGKAAGTGNAEKGGHRQSGEAD